MLVPPAADAYVVTPSDSADLPVAARGLLIGGTGGNIVMKCHRNGANVTIAVVANQLLPINCVRVLSTGTTATPIVALV